MTWTPWVAPICLDGLTELATISDPTIEPLTCLIVGFDSMLRATQVRILAVLRLISSRVVPISALVAL